MGRTQGILDLESLIADIGGHTPPLYAYTLLVPIGVTVSGYFVDGAGVEIPGSFVSAYAGTGVAVTLRALYLTTSAQAGTPTIPATPWPDTIAHGTGVVGFVGPPPSGDIYIGLGGEIGGTIKTGCTPTTAYPVATSDQNLVLGRVA